MEEKEKENEWGYKVVDKREDENGKSEKNNTNKKEEANKQSNPEEEKDAAPEVNIYNTLKWVFEVLRSQFFIHTGLLAHPQTKLIVQDFTQAQLAIDVNAFIVEKLKPHLSENESISMQSMLSELQINYVNQLKRTGKI